MFDVPGMYSDDEDERRRILESLVSMQAQPEAAAEPPMQLRAPDLEPPTSQGPSYTPPPAADPQYMQHVGGREFGFGDVAMIGGILASLLAKRGDIAGGLAGQYGGAVLGDQQRRNAKNEQIDAYNAKLAQEANDPVERWKLEQQASMQAGNLQARAREAAFQEAREKRIADRQAALDDPDSEVNVGEVTQAERLARSRMGVNLEEAQGRAGIETDKQRVLAQLLRKGQYAAPPGAKAEKPKTPKQELDDFTAGEKLRLIKEGKMNLAGEMLDDKGNVIPKPKSGTTVADGSVEPFADTEYENENLFKESASTAGNYQKNRQADADLVGAVKAFKTMERLLKEHGSQTGKTEDSARVRGEFEAAKGVVQRGYGVLKNLGVLQPTEAKLIDEAIGADMGYGLSDVTSAVGLGDLRVGKLAGARKMFEDSLSQQRHGMGLRAKGSGAPAAESGTRTVTVTYTDGETEQVDTDAAGIAKLKAHPDVRSVQ